MSYIRRLTINTVLLFIVTTISLLVAEVLARQVVHTGDYLQATLIDDPVLGHRIHPNTSGHDAWGYRNTAVPETAWLVAIGDSQTYGVNAGVMESWPKQLESLSGEAVYNMSLGGYGPLEYYYLVKNEMPRLEPSIVVIGLYFGNDIYDAHHAVYTRDFWSGMRNEPGSEVQGDRKKVGGGLAEKKKRFQAVRDFLARKSVIYGMLRVNFGHLLQFREGKKFASKKKLDEYFVWVDPVDSSIRTIFTPLRRLNSMDPDKDRVKEGIRIAKNSLLGVKAEIKKNQRLLLLLIPTKEQVYCDYIFKHGQETPEAFSRLCSVEAKIKREFMEFFDENKFAYVDALDLLQSKVENHEVIYKQNSDGHPVAEGYRSIAQVVIHFIENWDNLNQKQGDG